jgi:hypothetical protein
MRHIYPYMGMWSRGILNKIRPAPEAVARVEQSGMRGVAPRGWPRISLRSIRATVAKVSDEIEGQQFGKKTKYHLR